MSGPERERWERYKAEIKQRLEYSAVYGSIQGQKPSGEGCFTGLCPFHDDHNPSFGFRTDTGTWECFAGCGKGDVFAFLARLEGRPFKDVLLELGDRHGVPRPGNGDAGSPHVTYDYCDAADTLLFQVLRGPGKKFWQRRPDGQGGWIKNLQGVRRVLYRLPEVLTRTDETVLVVEGEKDADRLIDLGLLATTNSGGAGKWRASHSESLRGRDVVVLPDNDGPGREHAAKVVQFLRGVAAQAPHHGIPARERAPAAAHQHLRRGGPGAELPVPGHPPLLPRARVLLGPHAHHHRQRL